MSTITHLSTHASDHLPIMLQVQSFQQQRQRRGKAFKFEEAWLLSNECEEVVKEAWGKYGGGSYGLLSIKNKIQVCELELLRWGSARPNEAAIKELQTWLDRLLEAKVSEESRVEYLDMSKRMDKLLKKQEIYWVQRSRISWLKHGDKNTKFFHSKATQRRKKNHISGIQNSQGQWVEDLEEVVVVVSAYFDNLFSAGVANQMEEYLNKVTDDMQEILSSEFTT